MKFLRISFLLLLLTSNGLAQGRDGFIYVNGGNLYYQKTGEGPALVFLHGICLDHRMWERQVDFFSNQFTCISIDLRGFGKSSVPAGPYSYHEDIHSILDRLHINESIVLIAVSMGGKAAVNFSLAYPQRTKALILADVVIDGYIFKDFNLKPVSETAKQKGIDSANQLFLNNPVFNSARKDSTVFRHLGDMILSYSGWQWLHNNPIEGLTPPAIQQLQQIKAPTLIITGEEDIQDFQQVAGILHENIRHSLKKQIPEAGHMCNMEKPDAFNSMVSDFLILGR